MKLRDYSATLEEKMSEFDLWITPTLGEIRDTAQFLVNLTALKRGFSYQRMEVKPKRLLAVLERRLFLAS